MIVVVREMVVMVVLWRVVSKVGNDSVDYPRGLDASGASIDNNEGRLLAYRSRLEKN